MTPGWQNVRLGLAESARPDRWRPKLLPLVLGGVLWAAIILGAWSILR